MNERVDKKSVAFLILLVLGMMIPPIELLPNAHASTIIEDLTNGFCTLHIIGSGNVTCNGVNDTVTITHGSGMTITAFQANKTIFFNATGTGGGESTTVNNLAGSYNWFSSLTGYQINLRGLNLGQGLSGSQNSNTLTLQTNFGINSQSCPAGYAWSAFDNQTKIGTCSLVSTIVSQVSLNAQNSNISPTTLYTPLTDGVYHISVYQIDSGSSTAGTLSTVISWTDNSAGQNQKPANDVSLSTINSMTNGIIYIHAQSGHAISYQTTLSGVIGSPQYDLYITVEKLS